MKFLVRVYFIFFSFVFSAPVFSQQKDTLGFKGFSSEHYMPAHSTVIKMSPVPFFMGQIPYCGEVRITVEQLVAWNQSLTIGASYNYPSPVLALISAMNKGGGSSFNDYSINGFRGILGYRYYPIKKLHAPNGLYFGPYLSYNFAKIKEKGGSGDYFILNYANAGLITGYQIQLPRNVYLDFFTGLGYRNNFIIEYDSRTNRTSTSFMNSSFFAPPGMQNLRFLANVKFYLQVNVCYAF